MHDAILAHIGARGLINLRGWFGSASGLYKILHAKAKSSLLTVKAVHAIGLKKAHPVPCASAHHLLN